MKQKILILTHPFSGHINPMTGFVYEMATKRNFNVIWYGISGVKDIIEKTGSEYRAYSYYPIENFNRKPSNEKQDSQFVQVAWEMLNLSDKIMHDLIKVVDDEKPDLIIYDTWALFSKFLMQILENRYKKKITKLPPPPAVMFSPFFGFKRGVYPNNEEFRMIIDYDFNYYYKSFLLFFKQLYFNYKYGLSYKEDAISLLFSHTGEINIISTSYDLQPKVDLFNENDYFVGCGVSEKVRAETITNLKLKEFLDLFESINPINSEQIFTMKHNSKNLKLIYASLGTIFNNNFYIYECMIDSIRSFDDEIDKSSVKAEQIRFIISVGKQVYDLYQHKIKNEGYSLPENILLLPSAPQIEILKRASIFLTHSGMGSTNEAIHYGVPVICIPIQCDQPLVAHRLTELKLGICFNYRSMTSVKLRKSIHQIFDDNSYMDRLVKFSQLTRKYNGPISSANLVENLIKKSENLCKKSS